MTRDWERPIRAPRLPDPQRNGPARADGNRRSGAPRGAASARMHARFAKRANHISALSGAPLPLAQRGKVTGGGETPDDESRLFET